MINEDLSTVIDEIQFEEAKLIHEHYFVPKNVLCVSASHHFVICCITCGNYYCNICGKLIKHP
jgi:Fe2+ or Zn2+ uptake regulation protein